MNNKKQSPFKKIWCCNCNKEVWTILTKGKVLYPYIKDIQDKPFWQCKACKGFVGCHPEDRYNKPLGTIPTPRIKEARKEIHKILDPLWKNAKRRSKKRSALYSELSRYLGYEFHTGEISCIEEAKKIYRFVKNELVPNHTPKKP